MTVTAAWLEHRTYPGFGTYTVGITDGFVWDRVWIARGSVTAWPGLLHGGITYRTIRKRYSRRLARYMVDMHGRVVDGANPRPLPRGRHGLTVFVRALPELDGD